VGIEKWARSYSKRQRYNMMTSNNAETMNSVLRGTKSFPIVAFLKHIREFLSKWFNERRNKAENTILRLPDKINEIIEQRCEHVGRFNVKDLNTYQFEVVGDHTRVLVDMTAKSCSCNVFDLDHIPCDHAMAVILQKRLSTVNYVSHFYTIPSWCLAYRETIYPELTEKDWEVPRSIINEKCHPPAVRRKSGRPVKKRKMSAFEKNRRKRQCKRCGKKGHTAPSCGIGASTSGSHN
jgi:SWIM zinc finger